MKRLIFGTTPEAQVSNEFTITLLRVFAGLAMALTHGFGKIPPNEMFVNGVSSMGLPAPELFAWLAAITEFGGGILLAIGLMTRPVALLLSSTMLIAGFIVHSADPFNVKEMAFLYLVIYLVFLTRGSGKWSLDHLIFKKI
jgi:putative oxidoreductase